LTAVTPDQPDPPDEDALGELVTALIALGYDTSLIVRVLGRDGFHQAMSGNPGAAVWFLDRSTAPVRDILVVRTFFLREPVSSPDLADVFGDDLVTRLTAGGVLTPDAPGVPDVPDDPAAAAVRCTVDIRPVDPGKHREGAGEAGILVVSDPDASFDDVVPGPDHVPGVGQAPLTLLNQVPTGAVDRLLDLGTGSGVLSLVLPARETVATDIHPRALAFARVSARSIRTPADTADSADAANAGVRHIDWRTGSWFEPVADETFDRIVSNPPFVVGPGEVGHVYRDSGIALDGATALVVRGACDHLSPGGTAHLLGAWATGLSESPASRVAAWLPDEGIRAWIIQRDEVGPADYVRTWLTDESVDVRTPEGRGRTSRWLDVFAEAGVARIGMGYVHLQRITGPSEVTFEEIATPDLGFFGDEVSEYFGRAGWLAERDADALLDSSYRVRPTVARENVELPDRTTGAGFRGIVTRLTRTDGPRFSHEVDEPLSSVVAGLNPTGLSLRDTAELYCAVSGRDPEEFCRALVPLVVDLVRHGMLIPVDLDDTDGSESSVATTEVDL
jgi:methylase of polypeptide subunit release factors